MSATARLGPPDGRPTLALAEEYTVRWRDFCDEVDRDAFFKGIERADGSEEIVGRLAWLPLIRTEPLWEWAGEPGGFLEAAYRNDDTRFDLVFEVLLRRWLLGLEYRHDPTRLLEFWPRVAWLSGADRFAGIWDGRCDALRATCRAEREVPIADQEFALARLLAGAAVEIEGEPRLAWAAARMRRDAARIDSWLPRRLRGSRPKVARQARQGIVFAWDNPTALPRAMRPGMLIELVLGPQNDPRCIALEKGFGQDFRDALDIVRNRIGAESFYTLQPRSVLDDSEDTLIGDSPPSKILDGYSGTLAVWLAQRLALDPRPASMVPWVVVTADIDWKPSDGASAAVAGPVGLLEQKIEILAQEGIREVLFASQEEPPAPRGMSLIPILGTNIDRLTDRVRQSDRTVPVALPRPANKRISRRRILIVASLLASTAAALGWVLRDDSLLRVQRSEELKIGSDPTYPPMTSKDADGELIGFDVDLAYDLAERMGVKPKFVEIQEWDWEPDRSNCVVVNDLNSHKYDVIISSVTQKPGRDRAANFIPYEQFPTKVVGDKRLRVDRFIDLAGLVAAVQKNTVAKDWATKAAAELKRQGKPPLIIREYHGGSDGFEEIAHGSHDRGGPSITFGHEPTAIYYTNKYKTLSIMKYEVSQQTGNEPIGIALCKQDRQLQNEVHKHVLEMREAGVLKVLRERWLQDDAVVEHPVRSGIPSRAVIAHRGASYDAPESTAAAYLLARDLGADYLELDLQRTRDGVLIAFHDDDLKRTTNVRKVFPERAENPISTFTLEELKRLDAGSWFNREHPDRARPSFAKLRILTLDEVINIAEGGKNKPGLYIETKKPDLFPGIEEELKKKLTERGWIGRSEHASPDAGAARRVTLGRVVLQTYDRGSLEKLHRYMPQVPKILLLWIGNGFMTPRKPTEPREPTEPTRQQGSVKADTAASYARLKVGCIELARWLTWASDAGAIGIGAPSALQEGGEQSYMDLVQPWMNRMAHNRGLIVHAYTVDDKVDFEKLANHGVDGFFTNRPAALLSFYKRPVTDNIDTILKQHGY
jgi:glycerophosphoryl diester phosphodiesterase